MSRMTRQQWKLGLKKGKSASVLTIGFGVKVVQPIRTLPPHIGRNEACPCGCGQKFKRCQLYRAGREAVARTIAKLAKYASDSQVRNSLVAARKAVSS